MSLTSTPARRRLLAAIDGGRVRRPADQRREWYLYPPGGARQRVTARVEELINAGLARDGLLVGLVLTDAGRQFARTR